MPKTTREDDDDRLLAALAGAPLLHPSCMIYLSYLSLLFLFGMVSICVGGVPAVSYVAGGAAARAGLSKILSVRRTDDIVSDKMLLPYHIVDSGVS